MPATAWLRAAPRRWRAAASLLLAAALALVLKLALAASFTVTSTADTGGSTCGATCTLRQAINAANASGASGNVIGFNIPSASCAGGVCTITPTSALPAITRTVTIDGSTQPGFASTPVIELRGSSAGSTADGLTISGSSGITIRSLAIRNFGGSGIYINGGSGHAVTGSHIGLNAAGTTAAGNGDEGIFVNGAQNTTIGGTTTAARNVIAANAVNGVYVAGSSTGTVIAGNYIGTDLSGTLDRGNGRRGVALAASGITVGGTASGAGNLISGNGSDGIIIESTSGCTVQGNVIGLNAAGTARLGNSGNGVYLSNSDNNTIGGSTAAARNVIAGNDDVADMWDGVYLDGGSDGNTIQGNYFGTDVTGTQAIPNSWGAVTIYAGTNNVIGGTGSGQGNLMAYQHHGVDVSAFYGNADGNRISGNTMHSNAVAGITLDESLPANDGAKTSGKGNRFMDSPVITSASHDGSTLTVAGYVGSAAGQGTFANSTVELFASSTTSGRGQGRTYLGSISSSGSNGSFSGSLATTAVSGGQAITATARDSSGNTSIFSTVYTLPATFQISGTVFEDPNYGGGAGRSRATALAASGSGRSGARVELASVSGSTATVIATTTTDAAGAYAFSGLTSGSYLVRVVSGTVSSARSGYASGLLPVLTYRVNGSSGSAVAVTDEVGGPSPSDTAYAGTQAAVGSTASVSTASAEGLSAVTLSGASLSGLDFGYSFDVVSNTNNSGQGSLRQAITNANTLAGDASLAQAGRTAGVEHLVFMIGNGSAAAGLRASVNLFSGGVATITPSSALPTVSQPLVIDAQAQPGWALAPIVQLSGGSAGAGVSGLVISSSSGSTVRGLVINGFADTGLSIVAGSGHRIAGNYIGTNAAGTAAAANGGVGLNLWTTSASTIGGTAAADRNLLSGNGNSGLVIVSNGSGGGGHTIQGNTVGLNAAGSARLANGAQGFYINTPNNVIGGTASGAGNVIAGNTWQNVILDSSASGTTVQGNLFGLDATGSTAITNNGDGLLVMSASNLIGGTTAAARNVFAAAGDDGIEINGAAASGNTVQGNYIGTNAAGSTERGNAAYGVHLRQGAGGNTIGGTASGAANLIRGNARGVVVADASSGNRISANSIWNHAGLGIDLGNDGVTGNDGARTANQPNQKMDFPVFTSARARGNQLTVAGYVGSAAGQSTFGGAGVEVYVSDNDGTGYGEGRTYLGTITADAAGNFSGVVTMAVSSVAQGTRITGTATDGSGNTSEFGPNFANLVVDFVVNSTLDDADATPGDGQCLTAGGVCTLRAAIAELNAWASLSATPQIRFALPGCASYGAAACQIGVQSALPTMARSMTIDGTTQAGWNATSFAPIVVVNGSAAASTASGLTLGAGTHTVRGLVINGFGQNGILASAGSGHLIAGNWIGLTASGAAALANGSPGSATGGVYVSSASAVTVGGSTEADRNVLSGNGGAGVYVNGGSGHAVRGNFIGTDPGGSVALGNSRWGVVLEGSGDNTIGGSSTAEGNLIAGNAAAGTGGVYVNGSSNRVRGNTIGMNAAGSSALPNGDRAGVDLRGGQDNQVGGTGAGDGNWIAGNTGAGVRVSAGSGQRILGNRIHDNGGLGIDLGGDGVSANDGSYTSGQPNERIDMPVITAAGVADDGASLTLTGYVGTGSGQAAFAGARIEIFRAAADASGYGEGRTLLGVLTADAGGRFSGAVAFSAGLVAAGDPVTATATDGNGNTSEFGPNWTSTTMAGLTPAGFNAFDTDTAAGAVTGPLRSRLAGSASAFAVIALDPAGSGLHVGFSGDVALSWLDARDDSGSASGSCRSSWVSLGAAGTASFSNSSRVTVNLTPPPAGTRVMRLMMTHTTAAGTVTACSGDAFAALPTTLSLVASDADAATAGTTRLLDNTAASGGVVHRAGRPFTVTAQARDATGALMTGYDGTPTLAAVSCLLPAGCTAGALGGNPVAAVGGTLVNGSVSYAEVGAVSLQLTDTAYAAVDARDTAPGARTIASSATPVGRFVPDSLSVAITTSGQLATANGACMAAGQGATFLNQGFGWASPPQVTVTARNAAGATTTYWTGTLMKLVAGGGLVPTLSASGTGSATAGASYGALTVSDLGGGQARLGASATDRFVLSLAPPQVQPTVVPTWTWQLSITDASEAAVAGNPQLGANASQSPVGFDQGASFHSGRLALAAAFGDARSGVRVGVQLQRYSAAGWVTVTEDRGCVTVLPAHLGVEAVSGVFASSGACAAPMAAAATTAGGRAWLALPATPGAEPGRLTLRLAGDAATGSACAALLAPQPLQPMGLPWLLGGPTGAGPTALATWGRANRDLVLRREVW